MTTTYSINRDQIITSALRKLQVLELGATPDPDTVLNASQSLNLMIKAWQSQGIKLWTIQEYVVPLVASQNTYKLGYTTTKTGLVEVTSSNSAVVTASIALTTGLMTVTAVTSGTVAVGATLTGTGISGTITITSFGSGSGGLGTYNTSWTGAAIASTTVTCFVSGSNVITYIGNGLTVGTPLVVTTTGTLPGGLTAGNTYYVISTPTPYTLVLSSTLGGVAVGITTVGTGVHTSTVTTPVTVDQVTDKPLKVIQAWLRNVSVTPYIDRPVLIVSRQEYNILGSKFATGQINSIWYDPRTTYGEVHTYLTPDATTAADYRLYMVGQKPLGDILLSTDIPDFPTEWMQALVWGLADELAIEYGCHVNQRQEIMMKAERYRNDLMDWDVETTSTFFQVDQRMSK